MGIRGGGSSSWSQNVSTKLGDERMAYAYANRSSAVTWRPRVFLIMLNRRELTFASVAVAFRQSGMMSLAPRP